MDIFAYTTLCAIGNNSSIEKFEQSLPISNSNLDFDKIISLPSALKIDYATASESAIKEWRNWTTINWGTPSNGIIEKFEKIYSYGSDSFTIELRTVYNEPKLVIDKLVEKNPNLEFFIDNTDPFGNSYIAYKAKQESEILILCSHEAIDDYSDTCIEFEKENIAKLEASNFHYLHWNFLEKSHMGKQLKNNLINIQ